MNLLLGEPFSHNFVLTCFGKEYIILLGIKQCGVRLTIKEEKCKTKRLVSILLMLCLVCSMSSTVTLAECSHERLTMTYDPILERYYVDENTHYTEATVYNVCKDCGEEVTYISPMGYSSHEYTNGVCSCGAVEPSSGSSDKEDFEEEQHTHSWEEVDRESVYEYYSDKYHSEESVIAYYECECGAEKEKTKAGDGSKKRHRFNSRGVCKDCGYEEENEECEHENLSFEYDPLYSYEIVDETYHHTYVRLYYECDDCGESIQKVQDSGNSKHCFENGKCAQCGYIGNVSTATPEPIMRPTVRPTIEVAETIKATPIPTVQPTAPPHVCVTGVPSHWYGVYKYYDELRHTRHHVTTTYCSECGKELNKTNELEYVAHVFESGKCEKCGWKCEHINIQEVISDDILGYIEVGKEYHLSQHLVKEICNVCAQTFESKIVSRETKKHVFSNGYCKYCGYEEPLFLPDELPTGQYVNEELDSRLDYFIENIQGRGLKIFSHVLLQK